METVSQITCQSGSHTVSHRLLCKYSPKYFGYAYLGFNSVPHLDELFLYAYPVEVPVEKQPHLFLLPRNHGKTTAIADVLTTWAVLTDYGGRYPDIRILIIGESETTSIKRLQKIKANLERRDIIRDFGKRQGDIWQSNTIYCRRNRTRIDPTVEARGVGGAVTGGRFDLIILDDPISDKNQRTDGLKDNVSSWFSKTLYPMLEINGTMIAIGTRYYVNDFYNWILTMKNSSWNVVERKAIIDLETKEVLFPEKWTYEMLMRVKNTIAPSGFSSQYMNDPVPPEGLAFKEEWLQWVDLSRVPLDQLRIYAFLDPAMSGKDISNKNCNNAISVIGINEDHHIYLLAMHRFKGGITDILQQCELLYDEWKPVSFGIESNYNQIIIPDLLNRTSLRAFTEVHQHKDKIGRIMNLEKYFHSHRITLVKSNMNEEFVNDEYLKFPNERALVDGLDSLSSVIEMSIGHTMKPYWSVF